MCLFHIVQAVQVEISDNISGLLMVTLVAVLVFNPVEGFGVCGYFFFLECVVGKDHPPVGT